MILPFMRRSLLPFEIQTRKNPALRTGGEVLRADISGRFFPAARQLRIAPVFGAADFPGSASGWRESGG